MIKKSNPTLTKIVNILNDGQYHDGTTIGDHFGMTRSAVWKMMQKLSQHGIKITSIKRRGYALEEPLILLDRNKIRAELDLEKEKIELFLYESLSSTNDLLAEMPKKKGIKVCIAEKQTKGKGRLGRNWYSPFGTNIYLSCLYPFQKDISELAGLSLVVSLAMVDALRSYSQLNGFCVKWPNDILYDGKKVAGNLIEVQAEAHRVSNAIIGIGLNVNMQQDERQITQPWTSMRSILGKYIDRNKLCAIMLNSLIKHLQQFNQYGFEHFIPQWSETDCLTNRHVVLKNLDKKVEGKAIGVNEQGHLLMQLKSGKISAFSSGETSVLKK